MLDKVMSVAGLLVMVAIAAVAFQSANTSAVIKATTGGFATDLAAAQGSTGNLAGTGG
jgi:pectate lyase